MFRHSHRSQRTPWVRVPALVAYGIIAGVAAFTIAAYTVDSNPVDNIAIGVPPVPPVAAVAPAVVAPTSTPETTTKTPTTTRAPKTTASNDDVERSDVKCTDQRDYATDSRSNAEINSIGATTGTCPKVQKNDPRAITLSDGSTGRIPNYLPDWNAEYSTNDQYEWDCSQGYTTEGC